MHNNSPRSGSPAGVWQQIVDVLSRNGIRPSGSPFDTALLDDWYPADSLAQSTVAFWFAHGCWRYRDLLPSTEVLGPARSVDVSRLWVEVEDGMHLEPADEDSADGAGGWASTYDNRFVVIADQDGLSLVVDTRPGPLQGCISTYAGAFVDESNVRWPDANALFRELLLALTGAATFADRYTATYGDGTIEWTS